MSACSLSVACLAISLAELSTLVWSELSSCLVCLVYLSAWSGLAGWLFAGAGSGFGFCFPWSGWVWCRCWLGLGLGLVGSGWVWLGLSGCWPPGLTGLDSGGPPGVQN